MTDAELDKLEVRHDPTGFFGESEWELWNGEQLIGSVVSSEADAHLHAAAGVMREAIADFLKWENEREHTEDEWQLATDKLAIALAAARVPEGG